MLFFKIITDIDLKFRYFKSKYFKYFKSKKATNILEIMVI